MCFLSNTFRMSKKADWISNRIYNNQQSLGLFLRTTLYRVQCAVLCMLLCIVLSIVLSMVLLFNINTAHADAPKLKVSNTSEVISDPINGGNNPKRIPGAIVRYTIKAENEHIETAENVVISLNLTDEIGSSGNLNWYNNIVVQSPNIDSGANKFLTDISGDDEGEFVSNILTVRCGNITNSAPCIVTYDVEISQ